MRRGLELRAATASPSIQNMDGNLHQLELLAEIEAEGGLLCRVQVPFHFKNFMTLDMLDKASTMADAIDGEWLSSGMVKVFYDGVLESWTAVMVEPYADRPGWRGEPLFTPKQFADLAVEVDRRGLQIAVHAIGDGAVRAVLDGYEAAARPTASATAATASSISRCPCRRRAALRRARRHRLDAAAASAGRHGTCRSSRRYRVSAARAGRSPMPGER